MSGNGHLRAARAAEARRLRDAGLCWQDICERMGISRPYFYALLNDPDGSADRARKDSYRGICKGCGAATDGSNGRAAAPEYCHHCAPALDKRWTRDAIIAAIREFERRYGHPPAAPDFHPAMARARGFLERVERFYADGVYPHITSVMSEFGSWNAAIEAAGFTPRDPGRYGRPGEDPALRARGVALYREGLSCAEVARSLGTTERSVYGWLVVEGVPRRSYSEARRLYFSRRKAAA